MTLVMPLNLFLHSYSKNSDKEKEGNGFRSLLNRSIHSIQKRRKASHKQLYKNFTKSFYTYGHTPLNRKLGNNSSIAVLLK